MFLNVGPIVKVRIVENQFSFYFPHASYRLSMADGFDQSESACAKARAAIFVFKLIRPLTTYIH